MLVLLMVFCAAGAVFLIGLSLYAELQDLWTTSGRNRIGEHPSIRPHHR
jgi:hypothetical protein